MTITGGFVCFSSLTMPICYSTLKEFRFHLLQAAFDVYAIGINLLVMGGPSQWALLCHFFWQCIFRSKDNFEKWGGVFKDTWHSKSLHSVDIFPKTVTRRQITRNSACSGPSSTLLMSKIFQGVVNENHWSNSIKMCGVLYKWPVVVWIHIRAENTFYYLPIFSIKCQKVMKKNAHYNFLEPNSRS